MRSHVLLLLLLLLLESVYTCAWKCTCTLAHVHTYRDQRSTLGVFFYYSPPCVLRWSLLLNLMSATFSRLPAWTASETLQSTRIRAACCGQFLRGCCRSEVKFICFYNKFFTHQAISPDISVIFLKCYDSVIIDWITLSEKSKKSQVLPNSKLFWMSKWCHKWKAYFIHNINKIFI